MRLPALDYVRCKLHLRKQRFLCKNCGSTWGSEPILTKKNNTLSQPLRHNIIAMIYEGLPMTTIAKMVHCSPSSVSRIFNEFVQPRQRLAVLPKRLCFDEFRSVGSQMSFICCDATHEHQVVTILHNRLTKTITNYFLNRYSLPERERVQSVVVDLNAQYATFIPQIFPNAQIIIDRFHIVQMAGRALLQTRVQLHKQISDHRSREYKILKSHWRLFQKNEHEIDDSKIAYLHGVNEYMTQRNALDLIFTNHPQFHVVYQTYQALINAVAEHDAPAFITLITTYTPNGSVMDQVISSLKHAQKYVLNGVTSALSNGPIEGLICKIKTLKKACYGFRNPLNFFKRIACILK
ncbi:ISL3 family transposase [Ligilactobacillus saerimneri]|uniref:ISL3 family transposase n=1 Tax=Ligilactobacillus saerimneri TaxID=228229 RepID=UPI001C116E75|nr:ISL3 family transposase [Ligilactobacillus saerimneri]MBU5310126.1 ISL3 family transposase [Ligilactobacillus saerimneri]MDI9206022.1 ISL3 family transposase [Ligilactobacillus saerimneri]